MAYSEWTGGEGKDVSKYNPAALKMLRIDNISQIINNSKFNLQAWNADMGDWNYTIYYRGLKGLYREVFIKFSDEEKEKCDKFIDKVEECMEKYPIQERLKNGRWTSLNESRFKIFIWYLDKLEDLIKEYQDDHGLDTPSVEGYDDDEI